MASSTIGMLRTAAVAAAMPSLRQQQQAMPVPAECSSRPQKKATAHHMKTRPKKTQPWDVKRRGPTAYPPIPVLPPDWTLVSSESPSEEPTAAAAGAGEVVSAAP